MPRARSPGHPRGRRRERQPTLWARSARERDYHGDYSDELLARGLDLRAIQLLLGHSDLKTTQRYLNVTDEELRKTMQQKLWNRK